MEIQVPGPDYDSFYAEIMVASDKKDVEPYWLKVEQQWASEADLRKFIKELQRMIKIRNTGELK